MKKTLALIVAALMLVGMMAMSVSAERGLVYTAKTGTPTVDGVIEDLWDGASDWTKVDLPYNTDEGTAVTARVKVLHDADTIYFIAEVADATVGSDQDFLEFYINENGNNGDYVAYEDDIYQIRMGVDSVDNAIAGINAELYMDRLVAYAIGSNENGYVLEWALKPGQAMDHDFGLEFMYNDSDADGGFLYAYRWNDDTANGDAPAWQSPECWGYLAFSDESALPEVVETPVEGGEAGEAPVEDVVVAPVTADAGIVVAAIVMAAAAAVVVSKKH